MISFAHTRKLPKRSVLTIVLLGLVVALCIGVLGLLRAAPIVRFDNLIVDALQEHTVTGTVADDTVVIDIDDVSLSAVGQWPWPRYRVAALIDRIAAAKPAAIGLDVLFPEPDRSSLANIQQTFKRDFGLDVAITGVPAGLLDNDGYLGHRIAQAGAVGSSYFYFDHVNRTGVTVRPGLTFVGRTDLLALEVASGVLSNARDIASQTRVSGFVNTLPDPDGVLRRLPLLISHAGVIHPNLSLATVMRALGVDEGTIEPDRDGLSIRIGTHRIPIDAAGFSTLRFRSRPDAYRALSAVDVLNGDFKREDVAGKIVFIGSSAVGLNDVHNTALDTRFPGLKVQAVMAESIVDDDFLRTPSWAAVTTFAACMVAGVLMSTLSVVASGVYLVAFGSLVLSLGFLLLSFVPYVRGGLLVSPGAPILVVITLCVLFFVTRFVIEKKRAHAWLKQLENARQVTIESMASVAETRDPETGAHIKRTQYYVKAIAEQLVRAGLHRETLTKDFIELLFISAPLHDIGKVGVPDHILLKPGKLTPAEFELMKKHAEFGREIIFSSAQRIEGDNFLLIAGQIAATHHEKWDGTGYPAGLAGEDIPLSGRIMAVADIYDALISRRCYKEAFTHERSTALMREARGQIFDPAVLDAFFAIEPQIQEIAARFKDESHPAEPPQATGHPFLEELAAA